MPRRSHCANVAVIREALREAGVPPTGRYRFAMAALRDASAPLVLVPGGILVAQSAGHHRVGAERAARVLSGSADDICQHSWRKYE